ncbi:MAG: hypothetical protein JNM96_06955 [Bacteroidia bacterium]|nr:hypothetical protein [Bacteroidia bacterium]
MKTKHPNFKLNVSALHLFVFLFATHFVKSQEIAITERGDSVVLFSNGTWNYYSKNSLLSKAPIKLNTKSFTKPSSSTNKINGKKQAYELWYNSQKWKRLPPGELNEDADIALQMTDGDVYAMIIYEELEIPVENLSQIALDNGIKVTPDIKMIEREKRIVNNDTLIFMRMDGTTQGMKIAYYSYYVSGKSGSIQFHTFTGQALLEKHLKAIEELLNGLILTK